ncbi:MAG: LysR family transcriptional regulator [Lachnospiraceae bacterium]|nr:LysR family transcriptional regulator [Lachnospiraceae bacterium]
MTIQQLQYFITVCKYKNFTKAADELRISQPGISFAMKELEKECGVALFHRQKNNISITDEGITFLGEAEKMMGQYEELSKTVKNLSEGRDYLKIGIAPMGGNAVYPGILRRFLTKYPEVEVETTEDSNEALFQMLDSRSIDLALTVTRTLPDSNYQFQILRTSRLMLCISRSSDLAARETVTLEELGQEPVVMLTDHYSQTRFLKRIFEAHGISPNVILYTHQVISILQFIKQNAAVGFLPEEYLEGNPDIIGFAMPDIPPASICMVWKKDPYHYSAVKKFTAFLKAASNRQTALPEHTP